MNRILAFLEGKLAPLGERIGKQRHLKALREGIMMQCHWYYWDHSLF